MMKNVINKVRANATLTLMTKGRIKRVDVIDIPTVWSNFGDTEDKWINVDFPKDQEATCCLYIGKKGSLFPPHFHTGYVEHAFIINRQGKTKIITRTEIKTVSFPDSFFFEKGEEHAVEFLEDTKLFIIWHPKFIKGWQAEFLEETPK